MANPVFVARATLAGVGDVDVQLFENDNTHIRMLVSAGPVTLLALGTFELQA